MPYGTHAYGSGVAAEELVEAAEDEQREWVGLIPLGPATPIEG